MLALLPRAFLFSNAGNDGLWLRFNYRPNQRVMLDFLQNP
jgi:hypothetical protein